MTAGSTRTATALPTLCPTWQSRVGGINDRGEVAEFLSGDNFAVAVVWDRAGRPRALLALDRDCTSIASAVNKHGEAAGTSVGAKDTAVRWDRDGRPTALPPLAGDVLSQAYAIIDRGDVAGVRLPSTSLPTLAIWDRQGNPTELLPFQNQRIDFATPTGVNNRGEVVANIIAGDFRGAVWDRQGQPMTLLLPLAGDTGSEAFAISDRGEVAGRSFNDERSIALRWDLHGRTTALGSGIGQGINIRGTVVGVNRPTAVLWDRRGRLAELPPLPDDASSEATGISKQGEVVGYSGPTSVSWCWGIFE